MVPVIDGSEDDPPKKMEHKLNITPQTGISITTMVMILAASVWIITGQSAQKSELRDMKNDLSMQALETKNQLTSDIKELKSRMTTLETNKNSWSSTAMFRWAVHLQQLNKDPKKLQLDGLVVPEPEVDGK